MPLKDRISPSPVNGPSRMLLFLRCVHEPTESHEPGWGCPSHTLNIDRFGLLPVQTNRPFDVIRLRQRQRCEVLAIERLELKARGARIVLVNDPNIDPMAMLQLKQKHSDIYRFDGEQLLLDVTKFEQSEEAQAFVDQSLV